MQTTPVIAKLKNKINAKFNKNIENSAKNIENTDKNDINVAVMEDNNQTGNDVEPDNAKRLDEVQKDGITILGELLKFLREKREMSILMRAKQISKIEIQGSEALVYSDEELTSELFENKDYYSVVKAFFDANNLTAKFCRINLKEKELAKLNELLGGKLKQEN